MRGPLDSKLEAINEELAKMGAEVEEALVRSIEALQKQDVDMAHRVVRNDQIIDDMELIIENHLIQIMATQNPMASDLRRIICISKIITDLERMGDHAVNIAQAVIKIDREPHIKPLYDLPKMANIVAAMVRKSLNAFIQMDVDLAKEVAMTDDLVDDLYEMIYMELLYKIKDHPDQMTQIIQLLFIGRFLERIADHATNICERVVYMVHGVREKY